jgi:hypothetical protein
LPVTRTYRLLAGKLVLTQATSRYAGGLEHIITITAPAQFATVSPPFQVTGSVTVGPFENTLGYAIYDASENQVFAFSFMVDSPEMGAPGNFVFTPEVPPGLTGQIRIEIYEVSMADGSVIALASVIVIIE